MKKTRFTAVVLVMMFVTLNAFGADEKPATLKELKEKADDVFAMQDNISIHSSISDVWDYVDRLEAEGSKDIALKYIDAGLRYDPWALKYQLMYAEMMKAKGLDKAAVDKADLVARYAETDEYISKALRLLGKEPIKKIPSISRMNPEKFTLVILPLGQIDAWLAWELKKQLQEVLGIDVIVREISFKMPAYSRDHYSRSMEQMRLNIMNNLDYPVIDQTMKKLDLSKNKLSDEGALLNLMVELVKLESGAKAAVQFEAQIKALKDQGRQWDASRLLDLFSVTLTPYKRTNVGFLGITKNDIYANDNNFLFGLAQTGRGYGLFSYKRFTAEFNDSPPNSNKLAKRTVKQALSTTGFLFGIARCTSPECAKAYPNSLEEHDAKSIKLCDECTIAFKRVFRQDK